jgi:SP family arabinose:H+ symporter-like MFS transporter
MSSRKSGVFLVTLVAGVGGFLFGYDTAVINGANQYLKTHFGLTPFQEGLAGASAILGCIPGAMSAGFISDRYGRRRVLFLCAVLYAVSGLLSAIPTTFAGFLIARLIGGIGIGASSMICPVYIAELSPAGKRGQLGSLFQFGIVTGIFLTLFINARIQGAGDELWNTTMGWRWMLGAEVLPATAFFALLFAVPESPRWLVSVGRDAEAHVIFERFGGSNHEETPLLVRQNEGKQQEGYFRELFGPSFRRPLIVAIALMAVSQFSGINAIMYYSSKIFTTAGVGVKDAFDASVAVGFVNFCFTSVAVAFVDKLGRRPLLLAGLALQIAALGAVAWMFHLGENGLPLLGGVLVFIAAFAMALGPIPWIVCSEIFPTRLRGRAMSIATFVIWTSCYLVAQTFPMLNDHPAFGPAKTFLVFAACSAAGLVFVFLMLPETKGRTLEEIEKSWLSDHTSDRRSHASRLH